MGDYTSCDQYRKGKSITERECTVPRLSVRHKWVTDLSKMLAEKLVDYILITLTMKRTPRTKRIAEIVLGHLCDLSGIKTTLSTAKTKMERLLILIADRLAIWIDGMVRNMQKKKVKDEKGPTEPCKDPVHVESTPETSVSRIPSDEEESETDSGQEEVESKEESKDEEVTDETVTDDEVTDGENIKEEEEIGDEEGDVSNEEEEINTDEGEINIEEEENPIEEETIDKEEDEDEDQLEEPEDEEEYEAESEQDGIEEWVPEAETEMEELEEEEFMEEEETEEVQEQEEDEEPTKPVEDKSITPVVIPSLVTAGRAFEVKTGSECHYEIKQLSSTTVAKKVALAKGKEPTIIRKILKTDSPLNIKSLKEWAKWAKEVVGTAEQWGHWLDKTIVDFEKRKALLQQKIAQDPSKAEAYNKEYSQWLKEQQAMYTAFRVQKKRIKEDVQKWDKKLENKIKHDSDPEVETNIHNL